ncbi:saccharopine dehydrogenase NADP-binding domain-containing protein [Actinosynnema sp. NPDC020468]|uniref:saccharopine dehydrogenase NADP-binding domain-containing protein n=1 Tax=Actinosynnema sp. NPDC020468 TaxID=3154488 RepID=UPI0033DEF6FB
MIGVLGASGGVGRAATRVLAGWNVGPLRLGGRVPPTALAAELGAEAVQVDLTDPVALHDFCAGCAVVLNCAGPSYRHLDTVARAALAAGAHYVDPGGDEPVHRALAGVEPTRAVVLDAGLVPGLTAVLPRWLAADLVEPVALTAHVGLVDRLTPAGAGDYLLSLGGGHGEARAAWRDGRRVSGALSPSDDVDLPFFPGRVTTYPYLSREAERTAAALRLAEADWYTVFDGAGHLSAALGRLQAAMTGAADLDAAAAELIGAADLDLFGRNPYQRLVFRLTGRDVERTLVLRGTDTYGLTGGIAAYATREVLAGRVPPGVAYPVDVLDHADLVAALPSLPGFAGVDVLDGVPAFEEGAV